MGTNWIVSAKCAVLITHLSMWKKYRLMVPNCNLFNLIKRYYSQNSAAWGWLLSMRQFGQMKYVSDNDVSGSSSG